MNPGYYSLNDKSSYHKILHKTTLELGIWLERYTAGMFDEHQS